MPHTPDTTLSNRVLKLNVGFLLSDGIQARNHDSTLDLPAVRIADDMVLNFVRGPLRLNRTKEGILVQARLDTQINGECSRCLDAINHDITVGIEELFAYHSEAETEFRIADDAVLDLNPLLRAEVMIESGGQMLCRDDCAGLCPECGVNRNHTTCDCDLENIDPRMAVLKQLLDSSRESG